MRLRPRLLPFCIRPYSSTKRERILTLPNALSASRILAAPVLAQAVLTQNYPLALGTLLYCGASDIADGYLARRWKQESILGSILDPIGDKLIVGSLVVSMTMTGIFPLPLAGLMLLRDGGLLLSGFYIRYKSLPRPFTWRAYFDPTIPSVLVTPSLVSKLNTGLQIILLGGSLLIPVTALPADWVPLQVLQWTVAGTTLWSGISYILYHRQVVRYLHK